MFKDWMLTTQIGVLEGLFPGCGYSNETMLEIVLKEAGRIGIGLFHPPKKQFGQFLVQISK